VAENPPTPPVDVAKPPAAPPAEAKPEQPAAGELDRLLAELKSADAHVRTRAANRLFRLIPNERRDEVAKALEELTTDSNGWPRNAAIEALGFWGRPETAPKIIELVSQQDVLARKAAM